MSGATRLDAVVVQVTGLRVDYIGKRTAHRAVDGVDVAVAPGTVHAVIGESGSGKSTVLRAVSGSLPPTARTQGTVLLRPACDAGPADSPAGGRPAGPLAGPVDVLASTGSARSLLPPTSSLAGRVVGTMPQSAATALTPVRTFGAQLAETCAHLGSRRSIKELVHLAGLAPSDVDLYPHELSGGMAQRAGFALAVAGDPPLLLADEPTSALDPELTGHLLSLLRAHADHGGTVLLVTHDLEELERSEIADEISVMHGGRLLETGPAHRLLAAPTHPYTRLLLEALPSRGLHSPTAAQLRAALTMKNEVMA